MITAAQIRAARHLLKASQEDLAQWSGLSVPTVARAESEKDVFISKRSIEMIQTAMEARGCEFLSGARGVGVRVKA